MYSGFIADDSELLESLERNVFCLLLLVDEFETNDCMEVETIIHCHWKG